MTKSIQLSIHVAVDSSGHWFAWGSGVKDDSDFREESLALFRKNVWLDRTDTIGNDSADVEHFTVLAEIPIPNHVVFAQSVKPVQRSLFFNPAADAADASVFQGSPQDPCGSVARAVPAMAPGATVSRSAATRHD